jgi:hydrogenase/urease accessory protein HupE
MLTRRILTLLLVASMPVIALAHPGHGNTPPDSLGHYLLSLEHTAPIATVCALAAMIALGVKLVRPGSRMS